MEEWESGLQLRVVKGNQQGLAIPLQERNYVLGRAISHEDTRPGRIFFHDPSVALVQAVLRWDDHRATYLICHETDRSKSWVSGFPLARGTPRPLKAGSKVKFGKLVAVLEPVQAPLADIRQIQPAVTEPELQTWTPAPPPPEPEPQPQPEPAQTAHNGVDRSWFSSKLYTAKEGEVLDGPVAEFFPDGQLKWLATYHRGKISSTHNQLLLEHGKQVGRVKSDFNECAFSDGLEVVLTQLDGEIDYFEEAAEWEPWVRKWITQICLKQTVTVIS